MTYTLKVVHVIGSHAEPSLQGQWRQWTFTSPSDAIAAYNACIVSLGFEATAHWRDIRKNARISFRPGTAHVTVTLIRKD